LIVDKNLSFVGKKHFILSELNIFCGVKKSIISSGKKHFMGLQMWDGVAKNIL